jgi:hypothetical protein
MMLVMAAHWMVGTATDEAPFPGAEDGVLDDVPAWEVELARELTTGAFDVADAEPDSRVATSADVEEVSALVDVEEVSLSLAGFRVADADKEAVLVTEGTPLVSVRRGPV